MRALLTALARDPARRWRRALTAGAVVLAVVAGATATERFATRGQRSCHGAGDKLAAIWPLAGTGADRREGIHRAFLATGVSYAAETWTRVAGLLDDYARRWSDAYVDACEATHVRGDQSPEVLDLRMSCLERPRGALRALTDVLGRADAAVVLQAVNAAQALPALNSCADVAQLRAVVPPPADAATRARVDAVRVELADVKALTDTGQWVEARRKAAPVVATARAIGYGPLLAGALEAQGAVQGSMGDAAASANSIEEAVWAALASRNDDVALECAALLSGIVGYEAGRYDEAIRWDRLGQAILTRLGPGHERAAAWLAHNRGLIRLKQGELDASLADIRTALALKQKVLQPNDADLATAWSAVGATLVEMGDPAGALDAFQKQLDISQRAHGPNSPLLGRALGNRGEVLALLGRYGEAEKDLRESLDRWTAVVGPDHPWIAYPLTALGKCLVAVGRAREAAPILERAVRIRERRESDKSLIAESRFALARARWEAGGDRDAARVLAVVARDGYRALPARAKHTAEIDAWLAAHGRIGGSAAR
jgi:tetratricopeptide (TPR) repeat protein